MKSKKANPHHVGAVVRHFYKEKEVRNKFCRFCGIYENEHDRDHLASVCYPQQIKELNDFKNQYFELIMTVIQKFPNETRHQTALRYIREAEEQKGEAYV